MSKRFIIKRVGRTPIIFFIIMYWIIGSAWIVFCDLIFHNHNVKEIITDNIVLEVLVFFFICAVFIHPVVLKDNGELIVINFSYPFREKYMVQDIQKISPVSAKIVFGEVEALCLSFEKQQKNIIITDREQFCLECKKLNPNIEITDEFES